MAAAKQNLLDYVMLTDHSDLRARKEGFEGWHGNTLLIVGQEIAPRFNHYLAFQTPQAIMVYENDETAAPQTYIDQVNKQGGFGFIAHPDHKGTEMFHVKHYPWTDWSVNGYTGVSIWDFMTDWQNSLKGYLPSLISFFFPAFFLHGPRQVTLERWDRLNQTKKIVGIGELDNHGSIKRFCGIKIAAFPFYRAFKFIRTHICTLEPLSGSSEKDIPLLFDSLRHGRCYSALEYFQTSQGFSFLITQNNEEYSMGDSLILTDKAKISIYLPTPALIRIIRNGILLHEETNKELILPIAEKGVYRMEACLKRYGKYRPWIFSNPIYVNQ
jgi:hypothetical protein